MSQYALFITRNDIIKNSPLQGSIDADRLLPFMRTAQDKYILNLLGTVLFDKLQSDITSGTPFTDAYETLMEEHIKPTLIWYACVEYIPFSGIQFKSEGSFKHQSEQSISPGKNEIDYLLSKALNNADYYSTRLQDYLIAYSNDIPVYYQTVGNQTQVWPDQQNQSFGGIQL
jgi:hypothetical protein